MSIIRVVHNKENPYVTLNKEITKDLDLSYQALGMYFLAFSRPDDWEFNISELSKRKRGGRDAVKSIVKELEVKGYLIKVARRSGDSGKFTGCDWFFFETPRTQDEIKEMFPKVGKHVGRETRRTGKPTQLSNNPKPSKERQTNVCLSSATRSSTPSECKLTKKLKSLMQERKVSTKKIKEAMDYPLSEVELAMKYALFQEKNKQKKDEQTRNFGTYLHLTLKNRWYESESFDPDCIVFNLD